MCVWVREMTGRPITFKDCGCRAVFTKLANSNRLSLHEAAKVVGVRPRTMDRYHVADNDIHEKAADVLGSV